jgi:hypothetical protein
MDGFAVSCILVTRNIQSGELGMPISLPYLAAPGSIKTALEKIQNASTPERVTQDFVTTKLQMKGGTGAAIPPFLKKLGFAASDGSPTELYKQFRNPSLAGAAIATAIKNAYRELGSANEYFYDLPEKDLLDLIVQVTGSEKDGSTTKLTLSTLKILKQFADFESKPATELPVKVVTIENNQDSGSRNERQRVGLNLSYTINLNLPATSDQAVFNAIFRSLKEHLLSNAG